MSGTLEQIKQAVISGKHKEIEALVQTAVDEKVDLSSIINTALIEGMDVVGQTIRERRDLCSRDADRCAHYAKRSGRYQAFAQGGRFKIQGDCGSSAQSKAIFMISERTLSV